MTTAISVAMHEGAQAVVCASTGNTSASMAAYAARAGLKPLVLVPEGKIAAGKMAQAIVHGAQVIMVRGNFDHCLRMAKGLAVGLPGRAGQLGQPGPPRGPEDRGVRDRRLPRRRPRLPPAAGRQRRQHLGVLDRATRSTPTSAAPRKTPVMRGFQAEGAAPLVTGEPFPDPETKATAIRIGNPASWKLAEAAARRVRRPLRRRQRRRRSSPRSASWRRHDGVFVEPASAAGVAGLLQELAAGESYAGGDGRRSPSPATGSRTPPPRSRASATSSTPSWTPTWPPRPRPPGSTDAWRPSSTGPVRVSVPATSANLGPGFDSLGLALALRDELEAEVHRLRARGRGRPASGADDVPRDESHLVVRVDARGVRRRWAPSRPGCGSRCRNVIPHARGLGSSSAAIVAGVALARALVAGGRLLLDDDAAVRGSPPTSRATPTTWRRRCSAASSISGREDGRVLRRPARRSTRGSARWSSCRPTRSSTEVARGLLPDDGAARRRGRQRGPGGAAGRRPGRAARAPARAPPATTCTRSSASRRCPSRSPWSTRCAPTAWRPSSRRRADGAGVHRRPRRRRACSTAAPPGWTAPRPRRRPARGVAAARPDRVGRRC